MVIACVAGKRVENCYWSVLNPVAAVNTCARLQTCETIPLMSPVLEGRRMVLDCLARLEKADTYCSATLSEAAAFPFCTAQTNQKKKNEYIKISKTVSYYLKCDCCCPNEKNKRARTCSVRASDSIRMALAFASALATTAWASPGGNTAIRYF